MKTREKEIYTVTILGSLANALLLAFKFVAGILGHSAAMIADAVHSLSDFITDIIVLVFVRISNKPQDESHDYGHGKYETLATELIGLALLAVAFGILYKGITNIVFWAKGGELPSPGMLALWASLISILVKEILFRYTIHIGRKTDSQAVIANAWHHRSDALSSIGTAIGIGGAIILGRKWTVLDPLASVVVGVFIVKVSVDLLRSCISELTESSLPAEKEAEIIRIINQFTDVSEPHHLRTRHVGNYDAIEVHIRMDGGISLFDSHLRSMEIEKKIKESFGEKTHVAIHIEPVKKDGVYEK